MARHVDPQRFRRAGFYEMPWLWQLVVLATATAPAFAVAAWRKWPPLGIGVALLGSLALLACVAIWYRPEMVNRAADTLRTPGTDEARQADLDG